MKKIFLCIFFVIISGFPSFLLPAAQTQDQVLDKQLKSIIKLREKVENQAHELKLARESYTEQIKILSSKVQDIQSSLSHEELKDNKITSEISNLKKNISSYNLKHKDLKPLFLEKADKIKKYVTQSLPFKRKERLKSLNKIINNHSEQKTPVQQALLELASFLDDENILAKSMSLDEVELEIENKNYLASVIRFGLDLMYFKSGDSSYGIVYKSSPTNSSSKLESNREWIVKEFAQKEFIDNFEYLSQRFKKGVKTGFQTIALPKELLSSEVSLNLTKNLKQETK